MFGTSKGTELPVRKLTVSQLSQSNLLPTEASEIVESLFDMDEEGNAIVKWKEEEKSEDEDCEHPKNDRALAVNTERPPQEFSLLAPLKVPLTVTATELLAQCHVRVDNPMEFKEVFEERVAPLSPPQRPPTKEGENMLRPVPLIMVESAKDAHSMELHKLCDTSPIVLIRGLSTQLKMDLSLFSTKAFLDMCPAEEVEVRTQYRMPPDLNLDYLARPTMRFNSTRSYTSVGSYARYQAENFRLLHEEESEKLQGNATVKAKRRRMDENAPSAFLLKRIKFGTNLDLSDDLLFHQQLTELAKLPAFCRINADCDLLSHLGYTVLGMTTAQLYMKVPGTRTPAHTENNCIASVNINIGPGNCEWFGVPYEYWGDIDKMCRKEKTDFLKGSWWPNQDELMEAGIPVYRFTQKAGDMVWVGIGCVHWVQSTGWCNNVAWNVGPMTHRQLTIAVHQYEWNKLEGYRSLVPMQHLFWQIAANVKVTNPKVYSLVRGQLIRSLAYCKMIADWVEKKQLPPIKHHPRSTGEQAHYCVWCKVEVFNILFVKKNDDGNYFEITCVDCAIRETITSYLVLQQIQFEKLTKTFDSFKLHMQKAENSLVE